VDPAPPAPHLAPVARRSLADGVFEQLRDQILAGRLAAGAAVPTERELVEAFGVNRGAVREALKRLEQLRLVRMQQGGRTRVRDFRASAGLDLLPALLIGDRGIDGRALRSLAEMRVALGVDAARLAAERGGPAAGERLERCVTALAACPPDDLAGLQRHVWTLWETVVEASENLAYRLLLHSLRESYARFEDLMAPVLADELRDLRGAAALARAVASGNAAAAARAARRLAGRGLDAIGRVAEGLDAGPPRDGRSLGDRP